MVCGFWLYGSAPASALAESLPFYRQGILLAIVTGSGGGDCDRQLPGQCRFHQRLAFLPKGFHISSSFLIELAICLAVLGSATHMLNTLGHPGEVET